MFPRSDNGMYNWLVSFVLSSTQGDISFGSRVIKSRGAIDPKYLTAQQLGITQSGTVTILAVSVLSMP